jgi:hypothetical protein
MTSQRSQACLRCTSIIQGDLVSAEGHFKTDIKRLKERSSSCSLCAILLHSNLDSAHAALERAKQDERDIDALPVRIEVKRMPSSHQGLTCATINTTLLHETSGFVYGNCFIVQACSQGCKSLKYRIVLTFFPDKLQ